MLTIYLHYIGLKQLHTNRVILKQNFVLILVGINREIKML